MRLFLVILALGRFGWDSRDLELVIFGRPFTFFFGAAACPARHEGTPDPRPWAVAANNVHCSTKEHASHWRGPAIGRRLEVPILFGTSDPPPPRPPKPPPPPAANPDLPPYSSGRPLSKGLVSHPQLQKKLPKRVGQMSNAGQKR